VKKLLLIPLAIILVAALIFGGCKPAEEVPTEIRIGCSHGLTGIYSGFSLGADFGIQTACDDMNTLGGVYMEEYGEKLPVRYIVADNESDATKAATLAEDLIVRDKVHVLTMGGCPMPLSTPVNTVAERYKLPFIGATGIKEQWIALREEATPPWEYNWGIAFAVVMPYPPGSVWDKPGYTFADSLTVFLEYFIDRTNRQAGVYATDDIDGRGWFSLFPPLAEEIGFETHGDVFPNGTTDFSSLINDWKANDCELLMGNAPGPDLGAMLRQCHEMGFKPKVVFAGKGALFYQDIVAWGGDIPNAVIVDAIWRPFDPAACPGIGDRTPQSLVDKWIEDTGEPLNQGVGYGYTGAHVALDCIERAGSLDPEAINAVVLDTNMKAMLGTIVFNEETHWAGVPLALAQWRKTDAPWVWECPLVVALQDYMGGATAEMIFPIPYD